MVEEETELTSQVQVELVHRDNLRVTSSSSSTFDTESRTLRRLTNASVSGFTEVSAESLSESDRSSRFSFSERSRSDTGNDDVLSITV